MSGEVDVALPYWLDRPDDEALDVAREAHSAGLGRLWIGEMATFDAFALATAVGLRVPGLRLEVGPVAIGVRSPVSVALGVSSVAALTGAEVHVALGASSPAIVAGWHDRTWSHGAPRMAETIACLRAILDGERSDHDGRYVRSRGFRLRHPRPGTRITVAAFGPAMTRVGARHGDEVVLNLVPPGRVRAVRAVLEAEATAARRTRPRLAVWVPVALDPGRAARAQLASQLAVYLGPPGYGELFRELGFGDLVRRARDGAGRADLAGRIPPELLDQVCALGPADEVAARVAAYHRAGADVVAVVPSTAEDPGGRAVLHALGDGVARPRPRELAP